MGAAWKAAEPLTVKVVGGRGPQNGSTEVSARAVYTADTGQGAGSRPEERSQHRRRLQQQRQRCQERPEVRAEGQ